MSKADEMEALRAQGLTYREIADKFGCSYQNVAQMLAGSSRKCFRTITPERVSFDGLRKWMNENQCGIADLMNRICGKRANGNVADSLRRKFKGVTDFRKSEIDALIRITGLSYEELFGRGGTA